MSEPADSFHGYVTQVCTLLHILHRNGPSDADDWCEHGCGCAPDDGDGTGDLCDGCKDYYLYQKIMDGLEIEEADDE